MFERPLFLFLQTIRPCLRLCCSCVYRRIARVWLYAISADAVDLPVFARPLFLYTLFACTLFVLMRLNSPCLLVGYSCGCERIALICVYAIRADADEQPVFARQLLVFMHTNSSSLRLSYSCIYGRIAPVSCTLVVRTRTSSPCLSVRYACVCCQIARVCVYAIRTYTDE